jgi:hypothetical protein
MSKAERQKAMMARIQPSANFMNSDNQEEPKRRVQPTTMLMRNPAKDVEPMV